MSETRTSGPLLFTEPNNPTRVGEIINTLNEIYDIPMPRLGMSVYVKDEGVNYTITKLEPKLIDGVLVPDAKVAGYELQTGIGKSIAWNSSSNINDYVVAGVYNITGERLNVNDGLPIANSNPGHTISARLVVLDSSIKGTGDSQDKCITQVLTLSNRTGEDGNMYIRTGHGGNINSLSWEPWATLQTNINVEVVNNLDNLKDNGIYSGVWTKGSYNAYPLTFVCIVINDYFVGAAPRRISQFVYGLSKFDGTVVYQSRVWDDSKNAWSDWEILNHKEIAKMISDEIAEWIENHGTEVADILAAINANANNLAETKKDIANQLIVTPNAERVAITGRNKQSMRLNFQGDIPAATTEKAGVMTAGDKKNLSASIHDAIIEPYEETVELTIENHQGDTKSIEVPSATTKYAGVMTASDKTKVNSGFVGTTTQSQPIELNSYTKEGVYNFLNATFTDRSPILNNGVVSGRLTVLVTQEEGNKVVTQVLNLNNNPGGEGNVYIRSQQNGTWKPWGKLQTNVEVGQITPDDMSNLIDNGIYSGVCVDGATVETFVLIVINNYLAASQAGFGSYISQLKYSIDLTRGNTVKTRTRDAYGMWNGWSEIGGYVLPEATKENIGGVKLGVSKHNKFAPLTCLLGTETSDWGSGAGIILDTACLVNTATGMSIFFDATLTATEGIYGGLSVRLGSKEVGMNIIPCVLGSCVSADAIFWKESAVGIPYDDNQFELSKIGLQIKQGLIPTKVTWDANSNMNNYKEPGIYDIYGERTVKTDNLPITNDGSGHSIAARLTVVASTLQPDNTEKCITQFLQLSNRMGGEGNTYIRTYNENNNGLNGWSEWKKQQGMVESYINTDTVGITTTGGQTTGLNGMTENGMYSGIYTDDYTLASPTFVETFVLVVINDYAVSSAAGTPRRISQLKYATDTLTGQCTVKKRVGTGDDSISWGDWEEIGSGSSEVDITDTVITYGLPTLVTQGLAKEGVKYIIKARVDDISADEGVFIKKFDNNDKLRTFIASKSATGTDSTAKCTIKMEYIPNYNNFDNTTHNIIKGEVCMVNYHFNFYIHHLNTIDETVLVSADMTEL